MRMDPLNPAGWRRPKGYANAVRVTSPDRIVFVSGQVAWNPDEELVGAGDFAAQFRQALENVVTCVRTAGGEPEHLASMTIYVTDTDLYLERLEELGVAWREVVGRHYPAMALVQVAALLEKGALVEIQAIACLP